MCPGLATAPFTVPRGGGQMRSVNCCYLYLSAHSPVARMAARCLLSRAEGTELTGAEVNAPRLEPRGSPPAPQRRAVISAQDSNAPRALCWLSGSLLYYFQLSIDTLTRWSLSKCFWKVYETWLLLEGHKFIFTLWDVTLVSYR